MKIIILVSSIFYIIGLKIGNQIDIVKKNNPVEKIIHNYITPSKPEKTIHFEQKEVEKTQPDSTKEMGSKPEESIFDSK